MQNAETHPSLTRRLTRRVKREFVRARKHFRRTLARVVYSLPVLSARNPRCHVRSFKDYCRTVPAIPAHEIHTNWYLRIRSSAQLHRKASIAVNADQQRQFEAAVFRLQGGYTFNIPEIFLASISRARIYSRDFLVLSPENDIFSEAALRLESVVEQSGLFDRILPPRFQYLPGAYSLLTSPWSSGSYYHWLIDSLPRLSILEQFPQLDHSRLIVPGALTRYQAETLQMAGISDDRLMRLMPGAWQVDHLFFPELPCPTGNTSPAALLWLRQRFLSNRNTERHKARRLYVTRRDTSRTASNESQLLEYLKSEGFEVICAGELSFEQQIAAFSEVEIVVAPHGAALTNIIFAPEGTSVIELFGDNYVNGCFWALANLRGLRHAFIIGPAHGLNFHIPLAMLKEQVQKAIDVTGLETSLNVLN
jgi:hypothetical protein